MASVVKARQALEIGTASGTSSVLLAAVLASNQEGEALPDVLVETIDRKTECLFDTSKPIGFMVGELVPELVAKVSIHTDRDSFLCRDLFQAGTLDLAFIDGNHQHPWPLLNLLPLMPPCGWLILHDIYLPAVAVRLGIDGRYGAQWLFESWPLAKVSAGNIGAGCAPTQMNQVRSCL